MLGRRQELTALFIVVQQEAERQNNRGQRKIRKHAESKENGTYVDNESHSLIVVTDHISCRRGCIGDATSVPTGGNGRRTVI